MRNDARETLVLDALFNRQSAATESCFVQNAAGLELADRGQEMLETIERVLLERVAPSASYDSFIGLKYVLGAYALISSRSRYPNLPPFLSSLPGPLQLEALYALFAFFRKLPDGYNSGIPPGAPVLNYLKNVSRSEDPDLRREALELLKGFEES